MKTCSKCGVEKPLTEYSKVSRNKDGLRNACRKCHSPYAAEITKRYLARNPGRRSKVAYRSHLKRAYGITPEVKQILHTAQNGCCAICNTPFPSKFNTHVDHVHDSNPPVIRGLLCQQCNIGLGNFKDSPERLIAAAAYLLKFQNKA